MKAIFFALLCLPGLAMATSIVCDPTPQDVTHCGIKLDGIRKLNIPVSFTADGLKYCNWKVNPALPAGDHTIQLKFIRIVPPWTLESEWAAPFAFAKPVAPLPPTGMMQQ